MCPPTAELGFYDIVMLDMGPGLSGPLAQFGDQSVDQIVVVTTPEAVTATTVLGSLGQLPRDRTTMVLNMAQPGTAWDQHEVEQRFRANGLEHSATVPFDERLLVALDSGTYSPAALERPTRLAVKRLGLAVAKQLL